MRKGDLLVYGYNDVENRIFCYYTGAYTITKTGDVIITAVTDDGGQIMADITMFLPASNL